MIQPRAATRVASRRRSLILSSLVVAVGLTAAARPASAQLRIATYNDSGSNPGSGVGLSTLLKGIGDEQRAGIQRPIDVLSIQEQTLDLASARSVATTLNTVYGGSNYVASTVAGAGDTTQAVVYNKSTVQLVAQQAFLATSTSGVARQPLRFQFRPVGYTSAADFYVYSAHPKASDDSVSAGRRGIEATGIRANADALGAGVRAIYSGDFNVYNNSESFFTTMTAAGGAGQAFDPINRVGAWHNNASFADVDTQSPVLGSSQNYNYQVGGGLDDRFDFQLATAPVLSNHGFSLINGTYHAFGNAGNQFNDNLNLSSSATALMPYFPGYTQAQVLAVLTAITTSSDHLPVVADYRLPAIMSVTPALPTSVAPRVIVGANTSISASIANTAPVTIAAGADSLDFTATASGSPTAAQTGTILATGAAHTASFSLDTATPGAKSSTLSVSTTSPGVPSASSSSDYSYTVLAHATPSLAAASTLTTGTTATTSGTIDLGIVAIGGTGRDAGGIGVYDLADASGYTAKLSLTGSSLAGSGAITGGSVAGVGDIDPDTGRTIGALHFLPTTFGAANATLTITTSDEALPGATARASLGIAISAFGASAGDTNLTDTVDFSDLLALAKHYGEAAGASWADGDFDNSGSVDFTDLLSLAKNYGFDGNTAAAASVNATQFAADWTLAQSLVPEPAMLTALLAGALSLVHRRRAVR